MVPGQLVEIAGSRVGTITGVKLIHPDARQGAYAALIEMNVQRRFGPFYAGARCAILPQGPISENYVECSPGNRASGRLAPGRSGVPTVPVSHDTEAIDLQDVLNVFSMPTDERLRIVLDELGIATAGRGADLNAIIARSNPSLTDARHVLDVLAAERAALGSAVTQSDSVVRSLAQSNAGVRTFVDQAAAVGRTTAAHAPALARGIAGLPGMLLNLDRGMRSIGHVTSAGTPLLRTLHSSAPGLLTLTGTLTRFASAGGPALRALGAAAHEGQTAIPQAGPLVNQLARFGTSDQPSVSLLDSFLTSSRDQGAVDGALLILYGITAGDSGYDGISHFLSLVMQVYPQCIINNTQAGCQHTFNSPGNGTLPVNDPGAGPQSGWSPTPGLPEPAGTVTAVNGRARPIPLNRIRALLNYVLK
jgi:ABC-type transporter Mla subunit MlaD